MTNADRIRNMTDEELATLGMCPCDKSYYISYAVECSTTSCEECMLKWLQLEAETE